MQQSSKFNKMFIWFIGIFILVWLSLQLVSNWRLIELAEDDGKRILSWRWTPNNLTVDVHISRIEILKKTATDATLRVWGKQTYRQEGSGKAMVVLPLAKKVSDYPLTLIYYRSNQDWILGQVQIE